MYKSKDYNADSSHVALPQETERKNEESGSFTVIKHAVEVIINAQLLGNVPQSDAVTLQERQYRLSIITMYLFSLNLKFSMSNRDVSATTNVHSVTVPHNWLSHVAN